MITHSNLRNSRWAPVEHFNCSLRTGRLSSYARLFQLYFFPALCHERTPFSVVAFTPSVISEAFAVVVFALLGHERAPFFSCCTCAFGPQRTLLPCVLIFEGFHLRTRGWGWGEREKGGGGGGQRQKRERGRREGER